MFLFVQRAFFALCLISFLGCSPPARQWVIQDILTQIPCFSSGRLILGSDSDYSHLELEIVRNRSGIRFYVNLLFLQAPPLQSDPTRTRLEILFEGQEPWVVHPYLFAGGQRLLLPGDVADILIQALLDDQSFHLQIGRSSISVIPDHFSISYRDLLALPIEEAAIVNFIVSMAKN